MAKEKFSPGIFLDPFDEESFKKFFPKPKVKETKEGFVMGKIKYTIAYSRCDTPEKILSWVEHLSHKTWVTSEMIGQFVAMATGRIGINVYAAA